MKGPVDQGGAEGGPLSQTQAQVLPNQVVMSDAELLAWLRQPVEHVLDEGLVHETYLTMHPRLLFLKNLPRDTVLFDIGAGDGNLRIFREWIAIPRPDIVFVGASLEHGQNTRSYDDFLVGDIEQMPLTFERHRPTAAFMSHFIEHLKDPRAFVARLACLLPQGSSIYIEWPSPHSQMLPSLQVAAEAGFDMSTLNFFDDRTHVRAYPIQEIGGYLTDNGFHAVSSGMISMPFLADQLKHHGIAKPDKYYLTIGTWLKTMFASYISAVRV